MRPYVPAVAVGDLLWLSGQVGKLPSTRRVQGDVGDQTRRSIDNLASVLALYGLGLDAIVKCNVYLTDMSDFDTMNTAHAAACGDHRPAHTTIGVSTLPLAARVEIEATAPTPALTTKQPRLQPSDFIRHGDAAAGNTMIPDSLLPRLERSVGSEPHRERHRERHR